MTIADEAATSAIAEELREYADRVTMLADELERIEQVATADEITYRIRDGDTAIFELAYFLADRESG